MVDLFELDSYYGLFMILFLAQCACVYGSDPV